MTKAHFDKLGYLTEDGIADLFQKITGQSESSAIEYLKSHSIKYTVGILAATLFMKQDSQSTESAILFRACKQYYPENFI